MSCTFSVSDVEVARERMDAIDRDAVLRKLLHGSVEALAPGGRLVHASKDNALATALLIAFSTHRPLTLSPDMIWLTIARGFADHVNLNAEKLRSRFVKHEGKVELSVYRPDFVLGKPNLWPEVFGAFSEQMAKHLGKLRDLVVCDFSTTGPLERAASEVVLMDAFQAYFEFTVMSACGIPSITLLGTPADWRSVRTRAAVLGEFELGFWVDKLLPVLDQFVLAAEGKPDIEFWRSFFRERSISGGTEVNGHFKYLFPYLTGTRGAVKNPWFDTEKGPPLSMLPSAMSSAPVTFANLETGEKTRLSFVAGMFGVTEDAETGAISPEISWAVLRV
jgi:hypothetical protein